MKEWLENLVTEIEAKTPTAQAQFWLDQKYSYECPEEVTRCRSVLIACGLQFFQFLLCIYIIVPRVYSFCCTKPNMTHVGVSVFSTFHVCLISQFSPRPEAQYHPAVPHKTRCGMLLLKALTDNALRCVPFRHRAAYKVRYVSVQVESNCRGCSF